CSPVSKAGARIVARPRVEDPRPRSRARAGRSPPRTTGARPSASPGAATPFRRGAPTMADLLATLASQTGIGPEAIQKAFGALLNFLKANLGPEAFSKLEANIPGASKLIETSESAQETPGSGILGAVSDLAGKILGGKAGEEVNLLSGLSKAGLSVEQIQA